MFQTKRNCISDWRLVRSKVQVHFSIVENCVPEYSKVRTSKFSENVILAVKQPYAQILIRSKAVSFQEGASLSTVLVFWKSYMLITIPAGVTQIFYRTRHFGTSRDSQNSNLPELGVGTFLRMRITTFKTKSSWKL